MLHLFVLSVCTLHLGVSCPDEEKRALLSYPI